MRQLSKKKYYALVFIPVVFCLIAGCVAHYQSEHSPIEYEFNLAEPFEPKASLVVILDASASMGEFYKNELKIKRATRLLQKMNDHLLALAPPINFSFITIGRTLWPFQMKTEVIIPLQKYEHNAFDQAIHQVRWTGGKTPLASAITSLYAPLSKTSEPLALLVISDAEDLEESPVFSAENLKLRFLDRLCIHTIQVGNREDGTRTLQKISIVSDCGMFRTIDDLNEDFTIKQFVMHMVPYSSNENAPVSQDNLQASPERSSNIGDQEQSPFQADTWDETRTGECINLK
ncbi:MAG: VWA domain-containing protein [Candidatus Magnetomorum sp.]|nr:VWA domain-containing protein [Candidatus Magnetomorum sp.]